MVYLIEKKSGIIQIYFSFLFLILVSCNSTVKNTEPNPAGTESEDKIVSNNLNNNIIVNADSLTAEEFNQIITDDVKKQFGITYPIFKVFKCTDKSGTFYIIFTENKGYEVNDKIKGFNLEKTNIGFTKKWEINDFRDDEKEESIWFWSVYSEFKDLNNDGYIDPIIIYGTSGPHMYDDGRIKILIYYQGTKIAIRHQNGILDDERNTQVDKSFYTLPETIQEEVKTIMKRMEENDLSIFPSNWEKAMENKMTKFDESNIITSE